MLVHFTWGALITIRRRVVILKCIDNNRFISHRTAGHGSMVACYGNGGQSTENDIDFNMVMVKSVTREDASVNVEVRDIDAVAKDPAAFTLVLSGHNDHPDCNGRYKYDGEENGKPKFAKTPGGMPKVFWTGGTWDCCWGGYCPGPHDTSVPPFDGYTNDQGGCDIKVTTRPATAAAAAAAAAVAL